MLTITNLEATIDEQAILKQVNLSINPGEIHAIMGPNGSGKSTLSKVLTGHPDYDVTAGSIVLNGQDVLAMDPDERANAGMFLAFQYPVEIPGVNNESFIRMAYNAQRKYRGLSEVDAFDFAQIIADKLKWVEMDDEFLTRSVNQGFSGGEKKRNEILQMAVLEPQLVILDEIDSGLDVDALRIVSGAVNRLKDADRSFLIITHYQRLLNYITPDVVHIMADGKIIKSGDAQLALQVEERGYDWLLSPSLNGLKA
ncbi:Fe-S cluster assembly ATPase SufC [bacterium]|nr:Fe-S cluster assembly ATPase SufC [bacterium]